MLSTVDNKEAKQESQAVEQEREVSAEPDIESREEADGQLMEIETETESEQHESEEIEDREDGMVSEAEY
jgi:hypothetical protein